MEHAVRSMNCSSIVVFKVIFPTFSLSRSLARTSLETHLVEVVHGARTFVRSQFRFFFAYTFYLHSFSAVHINKADCEKQRAPRTEKPWHVNAREVVSGKMQVNGKK